MLKELYDDYIRKGFILSELNPETKMPLKPRKKNDVCNDITVKWSATKAYYAIPTEGLLIIDVDVKDGKQGLKSLEKLADDLFLDVDDLIASVRTGSGGLHIYARSSAPIKQRQMVYPDIDFQSYRANPDKCAPYVVCGGQNITYEGAAYVYTMLTDELIINELVGIEDVLVHDRFIDPTEVIGEIGFTNLDDDSDTEVATLGDSVSRATPDEIVKLLSYIDSSDYDTWMSTGAVLRREFNGGADGYKIFLDWSAMSPKFNEDACLKKWEDVGEANGAKRTVGSLVYMAVESKVHKYLNRMDEAKNFSSLTKVFDEEWSAYPTVHSDKLEPIAQAFKSKGTQLKGSTVDIRTARKVVEVKKPKVPTDSDDLPQWVRDTVYVESFTGSRKLHYIPTDERFSTEGYNGRFANQLSELREQLEIEGAFGVTNLLKQGMIKICGDHEFNPKHSDRVFTTSRGGTTLNLFDVNSRPPVAEEFTPEGLEVISTFDKHLRYLMSDDEAEVLLDWLAYLTQNFGSKILWVPLIQSAEGLGKSVIGNVMINHVFGTANSGTVDSNVVVGEHTTWAVQGVFKVLEEIKLAGHNRYEILNHLKPFITNHTVSRSEKYETTTEVSNFCNFIALTNFKDAVPLSDDDRRWWVVFAKVSSLSDLEELAGVDRNTYFEPLHTLARPNSPHGAEFHKWLMDRDITKFNPNFPPPSKHKSRMSATEDDKTLFLSEIRDIISIGGYGVTQSILSSKCLKDLMHEHGDFDENLTDGHVGDLLRKLNYSKIGRLSVHGHRYYVWSNRMDMQDAQILGAFRKMLDQPNPIGFDNLEEL